MIQTLFDYSLENRHKIDERVGRLRSVTEFCAECLEASKELPIKSRLEKILPWAVKGGELTCSQEYIDKYFRYRAALRLAARRSEDSYGLPANDRGHRLAPDNINVLQKLFVVQEPLQGLGADTHLQLPRSHL